MVLQKQRYQALAVASVQDALEKLLENSYHILILDLNMQGATNPDSQGLVLLKDLEKYGLNKVTQVIILSAYGTLDAMRTAFKDYDVADFLDKGGIFSDYDAASLANKKGAFFNPQLLLKSIQAVFTHKNHVNLHLNIVWPPQMSATRAVQSLHMDESPGKSSPLLPEKLGEELEDLFCRLFHNAQSIHVQPLSPGWSGTGVLQIQPFYQSGGRGRDVIVKFGSIRKIDAEYANFQNYVQNFISEGRNSIALQTRRTAQLGGIIYSHLGASGDQMKDFSAFYHSAETPQIITSLTHLINRTCKRWYINRRPLQSLNLSAIYQKLFEVPAHKIEAHLQQCIQDLEVTTLDRLTFTNLPGSHTFTNPLAGAGQPFACFSYLSVNHGDLNPHNMLVDENQHIWLIDFQSTGPSHILRDIATLDTIIRFQVLQNAEADLLDRLELEEILCGVEHYRQLESLAGHFQPQNEHV
ncbi:MAG TPA: response regulator, partial [Ktedonobacteraceae bacterium]|nr:response regulator [Ktedonobacteraceae bacterium]